MHLETRQALDNFTAICNWLIPHPLDERRFHKFITIAFRNGDTRIDFNEFRDSLPDKRFVDDWFRKYEYGIKLLEVSGNT